MILFHMLHTFYLSSFPKCYFNKLCFQLPRNVMCMSGLITRVISTRTGINGGKIGPSHLVSEHGVLSFLFLFFFFETVLSREHLGNVSEKFIGNFYF